MPDKASAFCLLLLLLPSPLLPAQEPPPVVPQGLEGEGPPAGKDLQDLLRRFRETHSSPLEEGLRSFLVRISFLNVRPGRKPLKVTLAWDGPGKEEFQGVPPKPSRKKGRKARKAGRAGPSSPRDWRVNLFKGMGDVLAGAAWKAFLAKGDRGELLSGRGAAAVAGVFKKKRKLGEAWFDKKTGLLERIRSPWGEKRFTYSRVGGRWALSGVKVVPPAPKDKKKGKGRRARDFSFSAYRKVNGFLLPTRITFRDAFGPMEVGLEYITVNGKPALYGAADPKETARKIREFESRWSKLSPAERVQAVKDLEELGGPKVAQALARKIFDRSRVVRVAVIRALGELRESSALSHLVRALSAFRKDPALFKDVCWAMGEIGDPRAVKPLAKKLLSGNPKSPGWKDTAQARIQALGKIEAPESVDELIRLLAAAGSGGRRATARGGKGPIYKFVQAALTRLTGQGFKHSFEWRRWWKAHRRGFFKKKRD